MQKLIHDTEHPFWNKEEAEQVAHINQEDDHDWTYAVEPRGDAFVIVVYDEDMIELGVL